MSIFVYYVFPTFMKSPFLYLSLALLLATIAIVMRQNPFSLKPVLVENYIFISASLTFPNCPNNTLAWSRRPAVLMNFILNNSSAPINFFLSSIIRLRTEVRTRNQRPFLVRDSASEC